VQFVGDGAAAAPLQEIFTPVVSACLAPSGGKVDVDLTASGAPDARVITGVEVRGGAPEAASCVRRAFLRQPALDPEVTSDEVTLSFEVVPGVTLRDAQIAARNGDYQVALALAEELLALQPHDDGARMVAAIAACNLKDKVRAARHLGELADGRRGMATQICERNDVEID
jgi:hypothetical protein